MTSLIDTLFGRMSLAAPRGPLLQRLDAVMALHRSRVRLAELDPRLLDDIGLSAKDASIEANRPIWDAPEAWKA